MSPSRYSPLFILAALCADLTSELMILVNALAEGDDANLSASIQRCAWLVASTSNYAKDAGAEPSKGKVEEYLA